jgi:hypothetical protein
MSNPRHIRIQDALIPAVINAVINGGIAYFGFKEQATIPLSLDGISSQQHTVFGEGVVLAFALGVILSIVTAKVFSRHAVKADPSLAPLVQRPVFPFVFKIALNNGAALFGWFVALAILWQRVVGTVEVQPVLAAVLVGLLAGVITVIVEVWTKRALLQPAGETA